MSKIPTETILYPVVVALLVLQGGLLVLLCAPAPTRAPSFIFTHSSSYESPATYEAAYALGESQVKNPLGHVYAGIIPHHLIVADKIAAFFLGLQESNQKYSTVLLLSPDHFHAGHARLTLSAEDWQTPYGLLKTDATLVRHFADESGVEIYEKPFAREHGVANEVAFIKKSFPEAVFIPIIARADATSQDLEQLLAAVQKNFDAEHALILVSADFSHDATTRVADARDEASKRVIGNLDSKKVDLVSSDSQALISFILQYAQNLKLHPELLWSTNSGRLTGDENGNTTSHLFYYFTK